MSEEKLRILTPTAGTPHCEAAVRQAAHLAALSEGSLTLLAVLRISQSLKGKALLEQAAGMAREEMTAHTLPINSLLRSGQPDKEILREAASGHYNLIVMGSRPWQRRLRSLLGSTSHSVLSAAPCPVWVAKGKKRTPCNILLCDSGAVSPRLVQRLITTLPALLAWKPVVTVLHVMSQISAGPDVKDWQLRADAGALVEARTPEGELLEGDAQVLQAAGIECRIKVRHGLVVEEIMAEAEEGDYDLVVIGGHFYTGWQDLLLDDLQQQIIACLERPVLVIRGDFNIQNPV